MALTSTNTHTTNGDDGDDINTMANAGGIDTADSDLGTGALPYQGAGGEGDRGV